MFCNLSLNLFFKVNNLILKVSILDTIDKVLNLDCTNIEDSLVNDII